MHLAWKWGFRGILIFWRDFELEKGRLGRKWGFKGKVISWRDYGEEKRRLGLKWGFWEKLACWRECWVEKGRLGRKWGLHGKLMSWRDFWIKRGVWVEHGALKQIDILKGFWIQKEFLGWNGAFRENCPEGIKDQYSKWIEDQYSLKAPFLTQIHFLPKKSLQKISFFPESSIFDPNAPFLPNNLFRTSTFPKSPIFGPKRARILSKNPFRTSVLLKSPIFNPEASFYQRIPSGYQFSLRKPIFPETSSIYTWPFKKLVFPESRISTSQSSISTQHTHL